MADIRYFAEHAGQSVRLVNVRYEGNKAFGYVAEDLAAWRAGGLRAELLSATRKIEFRAQASRHECDDRCMHATGRVMKCECSCGGKNHGRGAAA